MGFLRDFARGKMKVGFWEKSKDNFKIGMYKPCIKTNKRILGVLLLLL